DFAPLSRDGPERERNVPVESDPGEEDDDDRSAGGGESELQREAALLPERRQPGRQGDPEMDQAERRADDEDSARQAAERRGVSFPSGEPGPEHQVDRQQLRWVLPGDEMDHRGIEDGDERERRRAGGGEKDATESVGRDAGQRPADAERDRDAQRVGEEGGI